MKNKPDSPPQPSPLEGISSPGEPWAHSEELGQIQSELQAYASAVCGDPSAAADVVQEANMVIWEKRDDFQQETTGDFRAWAFRITYFKALAHRRDRARMGWLVFSDDVAQQIAQKAGNVVQDQSRRMEALQLCLAKIKPDQRELLTQIYGAGQTVPEYASKRRATPAAVYKTLQRLRTSLRECIARTLNLPS